MGVLVLHMASHSPIIVNHRRESGTITPALLFDRRDWRYPAIALTFDFPQGFAISEIDHGDWLYAIEHKGETLLLGAKAAPFAGTLRTKVLLDGDYQWDFDRADSRWNRDPETEERCKPKRMERKPKQRASSSIPCHRGLRSRIRTGRGGSPPAA